MHERELITAVRSGDLPKVRELCEQGADEDKAKEWGDDFRSDLLFAAIKTYPEFAGGTTPKPKATGHVNIVAYLLERGANANHTEANEYQPNDNQTPLHCAARNGYTDIAKLLVRHGADIEARWEATGYTPLAVAVGSYNSDDAPDASEEKDERIFDTIRLLVDEGADVNTRDHTKEYPDDVGNTILHRIAGKGELIEYFVAHGADVNAKNQVGWTPLHKSATYSKFSTTTTTARALIEAGADVNARDNSGKTPLDYAQNDALESLLRSYQTVQPASNLPPETVAKGGGCMGVLAVVWLVASAALALTQR